MLRPIVSTMRAMSKRASWSTCIAGNLASRRTDLEFLFFSLVYLETVCIRFLCILIIIIHANQIRSCHWLQATRTGGSSHTPPKEYRNAASNTALLIAAGTAGSSTSRTSSSTPSASHCVIRVTFRHETTRLRRAISHAVMAVLNSAVVGSVGRGVVTDEVPRDDANRGSNAAARVKPSSSAAAAPCARLGGVGCAASPTRMTRSRCQVGSGQSST